MGAVADDADGAIAGGHADAEGFADEFEVAIAGAEDVDAGGAEGDFDDEFQSGKTPGRACIGRPMVYDAAAGEREPRRIVWADTGRR